MKLKQSILWAAVAIGLAFGCVAHAKGGHGGSHSGGRSHGSGGSKSKPSGGGGTHSVRGHTTKNGTYVAPHRQTNPNGSKKDNWSSGGNANPDTGKSGTKDPDK